MLVFFLVPLHFPTVQKMVYKGLSLYYYTICKYSCPTQKRSFDFVPSICQVTEKE